MRIKTARVQNYRSIRDTGVFEVEQAKTILVGPNEAGKSAILEALQRINAPPDIKPFTALRDYPRGLYSDIARGRVDPKITPVATVVFTLDEDDKAAVPSRFRGCRYSFCRRLDNSCAHHLTDGPAEPTYREIREDLAKLATHVDGRVPAAPENAPTLPTPSDNLTATVAGWNERPFLDTEKITSLKQWLQAVTPLVDSSVSTDEANRLAHVHYLLDYFADRTTALDALHKRLPLFILFSNYFRIRPLIHLQHLADRLDSKNLDDDQYDYGNSCLLKLLGFTARDLSNLGRATEPAINQPTQLDDYRAKLDERSYQLNAASVQLTNEIRRVWNPSSSRLEANKLRVSADGQYLKVVVEDELGEEIELDQRSEGFQWLVSFFVVFFAEAEGEHENAILLLDEPGLSLHALKQREFRQTLSRLAEENQTIYTTHSPFLVGPDELDLVRVVELNDRSVGTKVHTSVTSNDPAALLPLQEALGYDLAQSLFAQQRNLILEGLTDYWYVEAVAGLLADANIIKLNDKIALVPAGTAGKVAYFATILHAHSLKVAALLDSDSAGDQAAQQEVLVHKLGQKCILRTKDFVAGIPKAEIEDLLRDTLPIVARDALGWDVVDALAQQTGRPLVDVLERTASDFSKYRLAKAFLRWSRDHTASDLSDVERTAWKSLVSAVNAALK